MGSPAFSKINGAMAFHKTSLQPIYKKDFIDCITLYDGQLVDSIDSYNNGRRDLTVQFTSFIPTASGKPSDIMNVQIFGTGLVVPSLFTGISLPFLQVSALGTYTNYTVTLTEVGTGSQQWNTSQWQAIAPGTILWGPLQQAATTVHGVTVRARNIFAIKGY